MDKPVVVGVDGSEQALMASRAAAREAVRRGSALKIVHAFIWPDLHVNVNPPKAGPPEGGLLHEAERFLDQAAKAAAEAGPAVVLSTELVRGAPAAVILHEARDAQLVVLGDRGLGGFTSLLVGSAAVQVTAHSPVPVLVVKSAERQDGPVVLGTDGSPESATAIEQAFIEASLRDTDLIVVHGWTRPAVRGPGDILPLVYDVDKVEGEEERVLSEAISGYRDRFPEVRLTERVIRGRPSPTLIELSETAQLVVVGSRGFGGFAGLLLGSVSQQVLHHAACPILIVPRPR